MARKKAETKRSRKKYTTIAQLLKIISNIEGVFWFLEGGLRLRAQFKDRTQSCSDTFCPITLVAYFKSYIPRSLNDWRKASMSLDLSEDLAHKIVASVDYQWTNSGHFDRSIRNKFLQAVGLLDGIILQTKAPSHKPSSGKSK